MASTDLKFLFPRSIFFQIYPFESIEKGYKLHVQRQRSYVEVANLHVLSGKKTLCSTVAQVGHLAIILLTGLWHFPQKWFLCNHYV